MPLTSDSEAGNLSFSAHALPLLDFYIVSKFQCFVTIERLYVDSEILRILVIVE